MGPRVRYAHMEVSDLLTGKVTALIGHSGVGKSTLVNRLVPDANRATGVVSGVGKGRHTSTQSVALWLPALLNLFTSRMAAFTSAGITARMAGR